MRGAVASAWIFGMGLVTWRYIARQHQPPVPGALLGATGFFALLALMSEWQSAAAAAALLGWGVDLAALMNLLPQTVAGPSKAAPAPAPAAPAGGGGGGTPKAA